MTFHELYERYSEGLRRYAYSLTRDEAEADDLAAEAFARVWTEFDRIRVPTVKAYLFAIARNLFLQNRRHSDRRVSIGEELPDRSDLESSTEHRAEIEAVNRFLAILAEQEREVFLLRVRDEMSYEEIASIVGITVSSAKVKVHRTRLKLIQFRNHRERS